jgi:hypothetical protein
MAWLAYLGALSFVMTGSDDWGFGWALWELSGRILCMLGVIQSKLFVFL